MQEVYNAAWYAGNERIKYPIDSEASALSDEGTPLPPSILADVRIVSTSAQSFYLSGVTCTEHLVSVVLSSASGLAAALTLPQPVTPLAHYALESFAEGVTGVIAFGHTIEQGQWRFSSPEQSRLAPACQIVLNPWPVTRFADGLQGDIRLLGGNEIQITEETVQVGATRADGARVGGHYTEVRALVIRLVSPETHETTKILSTAEQDKTARRYLAECAVRPDNGECRYITSFGGVEPDSTGNISIYLRADSVLSDRYRNTAVYTVSEAAADANDCEANPKSCAGLLLSVQETLPERTPMEFGRCGSDACNPPAAVMSAAPLNAVSLQNDTYPLTGSTSYSSDTGLTGEEAGTIVGIETTGTQVSATFQMAEGSSCGIFWKYENEESPALRYDSQTLTLGGQSMSVSTSAETVTLILTLANSILSGSLRVQGTTIAEIQTAETSMGSVALLLNQCTCTQWSIQ